MKHATANTGIYISNKGNIVAVSTGSDACTEHESGIASLMSSVCQEFKPIYQVAADYAKFKSTNVLKAIKSVFIEKPTFEFPSILNLRRINGTCDGFHSQERIINGEPEFRFGYVLNASRLERLNFSFNRFDVNNNDVAAAWNEDYFAICARGKQSVKRMKMFFEDLKAGHVVIGGTWFERKGFWKSGITFVNTKYISDEDTIRIADAQNEYNSDVRLKCEAEQIDLKSQMYKVHEKPIHYGFISPRWKDETESNVVWWLNSFINHSESGTYSTETLLAWAKSGYKTPIQDLK